MLLLLPLPLPLAKSPPLPFCGAATPTRTPNFRRLRVAPSSDCIFYSDVLLLSKSMRNMLLAQSQDEDVGRMMIYHRCVAFERAMLSLTNTRNNESEGARGPFDIDSSCGPTSTSGGWDVG